MIICWYSDGVASAVATKLTVDAPFRHEPVRIIKADTRSENPDNLRFIKDIQQWIGLPIEVLHNGKYNDVDDVVAKTRYLRGPRGARCTIELKKEVRNSLRLFDEVQVFGYTFDTKDKSRAKRFAINNPDVNMHCPLIAQKLTKQDCLDIVSKAGIDIPVMYKQGFPNNNCLGCLKAESPSYWRLTKKHYPDVYATRAKQERTLGYALCRINKKPVFLDELQDGPISKKMKSFSCDFLCGQENEKS